MKKRYLVVIVILAFIWGMICSSSDVYAESIGSHIHMGKEK